MSVEVKTASFGLKGDAGNQKAAKPKAFHEVNHEKSFEKDESDDGRSINQRNVEDQDIPEYIQMLEEHQTICEREGRYVEAEIAKNRISELRKQLEAIRKNELLEKHNIEKQQLEEENLTEFNEFNEFWDKKMAEFNEQAANIEQQMIGRHQEEKERFLEELALSLPVKPKDSPELLNLRKIQQSLAKQKDYIEAHKVQQQCLKMEKDEAEKWYASREQKIKNQKLQLEQKQMNELNAIRKRIATGQEEQRKARSLDLERLLQKYQNTRRDLAVKQQAELLQVSKLSKNGLIATYGSVFKSQQTTKTNQSMNNSLSKGNLKTNENLKRQPLHEATNLNKKNTKPLQENTKNI